MIHVYFGFISCFKASSSKRSLVLQPERMALLKSGIKRACQQLSFSMPPGIPCAVWATQVQTAWKPDTIGFYLLELIPFFPSRHSATLQTLCRRHHYGKKKNKNLQRLPTSCRKSEEDCSSRSLTGMWGTLAASGSEAQRSSPNSFSGRARWAAGLKFLDAGGQACTARQSSPLWCRFFAPCSPALIALSEHEASTQHVWTKEQKQKLRY